MRCALELPAGSPSLAVEPDGTLSAMVELDWPGLGRPLELSAIVDTGCNVDFVASKETARLLAGHHKPIRRDSLRWAEGLPCDVYDVAIKLDDWYGIEILAPLTQDMEDILGLPAILRSNLCIRGVVNAAFWANVSDPTDPDKWMARDSDVATSIRGGANASGQSLGAGRGRSVRRRSERTSRKAPARSSHPNAG